MFKENRRSNRLRRNSISPLRRCSTQKEAAPSFSPVPEEIDEDEEFVSDLAEVEKKLSKNALQSLAPPERRQTTIGGGVPRPSKGRPSFKTGRMSLGGKANLSRITSRRMSLGPTKHHVQPDGKSVAEMVKELKSQSKKHFHQKNCDEIKYRELLTKYRNMETKYKAENESLKSQLSEAKRQIKRLQYNLKRFQAQASKRHITETAKCKSTKKSVPKRQETNEEEQINALSPSSVSCSTEDTIETPAEIPSQETHYIKVDNLPPGANSQSLLQLCKGYGDIAQLRVMKDIVQDTLKGYVTFVEPVFAKRAVEGLQSRGYAASLTDSC